jgi:hypothetical protein
LVKAIPVNNHNTLPENSALASYLNLVLETYIGSDIVALSEKIFRSLVTPVPWTVYASPHTIKFLKSLQFDVMDDIVNQDTCSSVEKYVGNAVNSIKQIKSIGIDKLTERCLCAARHNQHLLKTMRQQWPRDFAVWWANNITELV